MSDKITAAESIRRIAAFILPMQAAADALESMGKLEQSIAEMGLAQTAVRAELDGVREQLKEAEDAVKAAKASAKSIDLNASQRSANSDTAAQDRAAKIISEAEVKADGLIKQAEENIAKASAGLEGRLARMANEKTVLEQEIAALETTAAAGRKEVDTLDAKLKKVKAQIAQMLG